MSNVRRHKLFSFCCTKKLLKRIGGEPHSLVEPSTNLLGDWYANIVFAKPQHLVVCMSQCTLLPVIVPAKNLSGLPERLRRELEQLLQALGVSSGAVAQELLQMGEHRFVPTASKSALGSLNEHIFHLSWSLREHPERSSLQHALHLARIPFKPLEYAFPREATLSLFLASEAIGAAARVS